MVAQLEQRPSRVERVSQTSSPINRVTDAKKTVSNITKKPLTLNFICMCLVAATFDIIGLFVNEIPGVGIALQITADVIFIPWFYFSGIKFNAKRIGSMATTSILESIPVIGNLPMILGNVIFSYYSN